MKKLAILGLALLVAVAAKAAPRRVALIVQNHTTVTNEMPVSALADTLAARLSGKAIRVVNPQNTLGYGQNTTSAGEEMPESSAKEIANLVGADGVITASITSFAVEDIGTPAVAKKVAVRMAISLADAANGETVCSVDEVETSKNFTVELMQENASSLYETVLHSAAMKGAKAFLAALDEAGWQEPARAEMVNVNFTCNTPGADIKIDGVAFGTIPALVTVPKGVHNLAVEYPYCVPYRTRAYFTDGQTYNVVLQLTDEGRNRFKDQALFTETVDRIRKTGATDDQVRIILAEGTAQYWKQSGVKIEHGDAPGLRLEPPGDKDRVAPVAPTVDMLIDKARGVEEKKPETKAEPEPEPESELEPESEVAPEEPVDR